MIDLVIVSDAKTEALKKLTIQTVETALAGAKKAVDIWVVEKQKNVYDFGLLNVHIVEYEFEFNYNRCLNYGAKMGGHPFVMFCNNDLIFSDGWTDLVDRMKLYRLSSISPLCPRTGNEYGLKLGAGMKPATMNRNADETRMLFAGWCFMLKREAWNKIGRLDERRKFWTADNATLMQLKANHLKHGLDCNIRVDHVQSATLKTLDRDTKKAYEVEEVKRYNRDYNKNIFNWGKAKADA